MPLGGDVREASVSTDVIIVSHAWTLFTPKSRVVLATVFLMFEARSRQCPLKLCACHGDQSSEERGGYVDWRTDPVWHSGPLLPTVECMMED
ncbi:hypothetical protein C0Q70_21282 [Pomacea canaliculata]|uniref:Uncharacterized protein n=1 Tax=Pomacea canaliculata TaxID=400727 RepID=A0A2T7NC40_POMCA|nr:hypothetical protein C0Q70_21282 [Pomacea canaliculata]